MTAPATDAPSDRGVNLLLVAVLVVTLGTLLIAAVALPNILGQGSTLRAQVRSDEITACRSAHRANIDQAESVSKDAESRRLDAFAAVILAAAEDSDLAEATSLLRSTSLEAASARADVRDAVDAYDDAVAASSEDPDAFLVACQTDPP